MKDVLEKWVSGESDADEPPKESTDTTTEVEEEVASVTTKKSELNTASTDDVAEAFEELFSK